MRPQESASDDSHRPRAHVTRQLAAAWPAGPAIRSTRPTQGAARVGSNLSVRELEVLRLLSALLTTEEIAAELFISVNTVRTHVRRIFEKLGVSRRNDAVRRARELKLV